MPSWDAIRSWALQNILWEIVMAAVATMMFRIGTWIRGKSISARKEIAFWVTGILGGTILLVVANRGFVNPLREGQNQNAGRPDLHCEIISSAIADSNIISLFDQTTNPVTVVYFRASVVNNGMPSIAWKWRLKAQLVSGIPVESWFTYPVDPGQPGIVGSSSHGRAPFVIPPDQFLVPMLLQNPLPYGSAKIGWLVFPFKPSLRSELERPGVRLTLEFEDCMGHVVSTQKSFDENSWSY